MPDLGLPTMMIGSFRGFRIDQNNKWSTNCPIETMVLRNNNKIPDSRGDTHALKVFPRIRYNLNIRLSIIICLYV